MSTHTIKRTMLTGPDADTGDLEFVLKLEHPQGNLLIPLAGELATLVETPAAADKYLLFGALLGNTLSTAPFERFAHRIEGHTVVWSDELSITVPDELE